jgi:hypothetical protein
MSLELGGTNEEYDSAAKIKISIKATEIINDDDSRLSASKQPYDPDTYSHFTLTPYNPVYINDPNYHRMN